MANIIASATGNFTVAGTWGAVDAASELNSSNSANYLDTTNRDSATFIPAAVAIDAVALRCYERAATPTGGGTFTVTLRNSTTSTDIQSVTVNYTDMHVSGAGWMLFKFGATHTPNGTDSYVIRCVASTAGSNVAFWVGSGSFNWSRKLRTTTTQAPSVNDHIMVCNEYTAAATFNTITVTMNNTAVTSWGPAVSGGFPDGIVVSGGGTLTWGTSGSTDYSFKYKGIFWIAGGGNVTVGTSGTPIPSTSTSDLWMDCASHGDTGILVEGGTFTHQGPTKANITLLTADAAAAATSFTCVSTTLWEVGDLICLAGTNKATADFNEERVLNTIPTATTFTITAGLTTARTFAAQYPAEVINKTQRCKIRGTSLSLCGWIRVIRTGVVLCRYAEMRFLGTGTTNKRGIDCQQATGGSVTVENCSMWEWHQDSIVFYTSGTSLGVNTGGNYNGIVIQSGSYFISGYTTQASSPLWSFDGNYTLGGSSAGWQLQFTSTNPSVFRNNRIAGNTSNTQPGIRFEFRNEGLLDFGGSAVAANWSGNVLHNCGIAGIHITYVSGLSFNADWPRIANLYLKDWLVYYNGRVADTSGIEVRGIVLIDPVFENLQTWGNGAGTAAGGFRVLAVPYTIVSDAVFINPSSGGSPISVAFDQTAFLNIQGGYFTARLEGGNLGVVATGRVAHSTSDLYLTLASGTVQIVCRNTKLSSTTPVSSISAANSDSTSVRVNRFGQTNGDHRSWFKRGTIKTDTVIFDTASPSERLTPNSASFKLVSSPRQHAVASGATKTVNARVRKSAVGDGTAYTGAQPRLMVRMNTEAGITSDTVLDTMTVAVGNWETLTGTTATVATDVVLEFFVDCDGTAGWVNVDDWS